MHTYALPRSLLGPTTPWACPTYYLGVTITLSLALHTTSTTMNNTIELIDFLQFYYGKYSKRTPI